MAFKITNLAKDLGIKSKEITELLTARGVECKSTQKTLEPAEFDIVFGEGISQEGCIMDMGVQYDIIAKSGSFFSYNGNKIAQGKEKLRAYLKENPEVKAEIENKIRAAAKGTTVAEENAESEE